MNASNYKSTIGGAFSAVGSMLMGIGIVPQLNGAPSHTLSVIAMVGFICNAIGAFLAHLFAADAKSLADLAQKVDQNQSAILTGDTTLLRKSAEPPPAPPKP